jgi:RNA polymerase sigma-70 factor (ECF subfamily)
MAMAIEPAGLSKRDDVERVYRRQRSTLRAIASRSGDPDSEDIVQDSFLKTISAEQDGNLRSSFAFLLKVTRNAVIDRLRQKAYRSSIVTSMGEGIMDAPDASPDPERAAIASDRLSRVMEIIESMPPRRKEVLLLHRLENATYRQISERLGISPRTVENHLAAGMAQLSRELDGDTRCSQ